MRAFISIVAFVALCGCCGQKMVKEEEWSSWRAYDSRFSPREREVVSAARSYLEKKFGVPVDAFYTVNGRENGYAVIVRFPLRYQDGRPVFGPTSEGIVEVNKDLSVIQYLPGY